MRLESFRARGFGPFRSEFSVDLSEMRGLVAVTGLNGAGKSTFLELALPGALYRQTPTRGSLGDLAVARDACLDVTVVNGSRWQVKHLVDGVSKKSEALVLREGATVPGLESGKVKAYDEWAASHWPAPEVLLSTIFGAQGAGGFLAAKPGERKSILLRVLGIEALERKAEQARERAKAAKAAADTAAARLQDERARGGDVAQLEQRLTDLRDALFRNENAALAAQKQLDNATEEEQRIRLAEERNAATLRLRQAIDVRIDQARAEVKDLDERIANNQAVLAEADAIRAAVADLERLQAELAEAGAAVVTAEAAAQAALAPWTNVAARIRDAQFRADRAAARLKDKPAVEKAQSDLPGLRTAAEEASATVSGLVVKLEELQGAHIAGAGERIVALRSGLETVDALAEHDMVQDDIRDAARKALRDDDAAITAAETTPARIAEAKQQLSAARDRVAVLERQVTDAERLAGRAADLEGAEAERQAALAEVTTLTEGYAAGGVEAKAKCEAVTELQVKVQGLRASIATAQPMAAKSGPLEKAETLVAERRTQKAAVEDRLAVMLTERKAFEVLEPVAPPPDMLTLRRELKTWQDASNEARGSIAAVEQRLEQAKASASRQLDLLAELLVQQDQLADWTRVALDLGKDGLQALEIDAAGPELTAYTNELLHACHGPRFTARVDTQRVSSDGKKMLEGCDVMVLDTVAGREAAGETFSGGERVILAEALSLAILVLACRRNGLTDVSLVRDESGAALDPANARVYVAMLRKAVEMVGARHCLLVSHVPEVQELCDHRIEVGSAA